MGDKCCSVINFRNELSELQLRLQDSVDSRQLALVNTKLEEAIFWCEKHCVEVLGIPVEELMLASDAPVCSESSTECGGPSCDSAA